MIGNNAEEFPPFCKAICFMAPLNPNVRSFLNILPMIEKLICLLGSFLGPLNKSWD